MNDLVRLSCPHCGFSRDVPRLKIPAYARVVTCPHCTQRFALPAQAGQAPAAAAVLAETSDRTLGQIFDQAWTVYRQRWGTLLGLLLITYLLLLVPVGAGLAAGGIASLYLPDEVRVHLLLLGTLCGLAVGLLTMFWGYAAYLAAALDPELSVNDALKRGWPLCGPVLWAVSLAGLLAAGGFLLAIVPGILLSVWFAFVPFLAIDGRHGMDSLSASRRLVAGRFWDVLLKFLVASLVPSAIGAIPLVGPLLGLAATPFSTLMMVMVYRDRQAGCAQSPPAEPLPGGPASWWAIALGGYALLGLGLLFIASRLW